MFRKTLIAAFAAAVLLTGLAAAMPARAAAAPAAPATVNCHVRWHLDFYAKPHPHMRFRFTHVASNCHLLKSEAVLECVYPPHAVITKWWFGNPIRTVGPWSKTRCKAITVGTHHNVNGGAIWAGYRYFRDGAWHKVKVLPK